MKNKKGVIDQIMSILTIIIVLAIVIIIFWVGSTLLPIFAGTGNNVLSQIQTTIDTNSPNSELANASRVATTMGTNIIGTFEYLVYIGLIIMFVGFFIMAFYVRSYPFLAFFWVFMVIGLVFLSMILSNAYTTASTQPVTQSYYQTWGSNDFIMSYLPHIVTFVGVIGGIFLFVLATREPESEVQTL